MSLYVGDLRYAGLSLYLFIPILYMFRATKFSKHIENLNKQIQNKELCPKLVIYKGCDKTHGQQNIKECNMVVNIKPWLPLLPRRYS